LFFVLTSIFYSQEKEVTIDPEGIIIEEVTNGKIENNVFICNLFDWKIAIPEGFKVTELKTAEELQNKGYAFIKNNAPESAYIHSKPPILIGFEMK